MDYLSYLYTPGGIVVCIGYRDTRARVRCGDAALPWRRRSLPS
jgi:hypothetical protein